MDLLLDRRVGRPGPGDPTHFLNIRIEIERDPGDLDVVPRLESLGLQRAEHADPAQPALQVRERDLLDRVRAGEEPLDPGPGDAEAAVTGARNAERPPSGRTKHPMLGEFTDRPDGNRACGPRRPRGRAALTPPPAEGQNPLCAPSPPPPPGAIASASAAPTGGGTRRISS